jgi:DNA-binding Xre family transcriptional regulator
MRQKQKNDTGGENLGITYKPLYRLMAEKEMGWEELREGIGAASGTTAKMHQGTYVKLEVIERVCRFLGCRVEDVIQFED